MVKPVLVLLALACLAAPSASYATEPGGQKPAGDAKEEFDRATRYFEAEEYDAALPHFRRAYELSNRRPAAIFGLAQCLRTLKRYEESIKYFEEYIATEPEDVVRAKETVVLLRELDAKQKKDAAARAEKTPPPPPVEKEPAPTEPAATEPPPRLTQAAPPEEDSDSIVESPWFWVITGAAVVGGGVALGFALGSGTDSYGGNTGIVLAP